MRKFVCIFSIICILAFSFSFVSSAASSFTSKIFEPSAFVDTLGSFHSYFWVNSDSEGLLFEVVAPSVTVFIDNEISFNVSNNYGLSSPFRISIYQMSTGTLLTSYSFSVAANQSLYLDSDDYLYNSTSSLDALINSIFSSSSSYSYSSYLDISLSVTNLNSSFSESSIPVIFKESFSEGILLSDLPEPVADDYNRYIVFGMGERASLVQLTTVGPTVFDNNAIRLECRSSGTFFISCVKSDTPYSLIVSVFNVSDGTYIASSELQVPAGSGYYNFQFVANYLTVNSVFTYGLPFDNQSTYIFDLPVISWNSFVEQSLAVILSLNLLRFQLASMNREVEDVHDLLYDFYLNNSLYLDDIYETLLKFYNLYSGEGDTYSEPSTDALDNYLSDESKVYDVLPTGMQQNIDYALESGDVVFSGNGAFALIRGLMQSLVFNIPKLSGFVLFALAIGVAVLILGRKINSG